MKRIVIIAVVLAVAGVGVWSGLWFLGKGEIEKRIDLEAASAQQQGWTVTWGERTVAGFPTDYVVTLKDLAAIKADTGALVKVPEVTVQQDPKAPDRFVAQLPAEMTVNLPVSETMRAQDPNLPRVLEVRIASANLQVGLTGAMPTARAHDVAADSLSIAIEQSDFPWRMGLSFQALRATQTPSDKGDNVNLTASVIQLGVLDRQAESRPDLNAEYREVSVTTKVALPDFDDLIASLLTSEQTLDGTYIIGSHTIGITSLNGDVEQKMIYDAGATTGLFTLARGVLDYQSDERLAVVELTNAGLGPDPQRIAAETFQRRIKTPVIPTDEPHSGALRIALLGLEADQPLWQMLDPSERLDRSPAELLVHLETTQRLNPAAALPVEFSNISIKALELKALDAEASLKGDVEILQPINLPLGDLTLRLKGASRLLRALTEAGLIPPQIRTTGDAMLEVYAKPGKSVDSWVSEIKFENTGVTMNGLPVPPKQQTAPTQPGLLQPDQ